jgi:3-isopropylmalate/(R)-2-methylmalate dehydratase small subunit
MSRIIRGKVYVVGNHVDTDQIIPAQYLSLVPTVPEEYRQLGEYALCGLPRDQYPRRLVEPSGTPSPYRIVVAGRNFGCGSSREHAPIALGAAGIRAVIAESFARIFFRNCIATGELYPIETERRLCESLQTGDEVAVDFVAAHLRVTASGATYPIRPLGEVEKVVSAGGLFAYARTTGLVGEGRPAT